MNDQRASGEPFAAATGSSRLLAILRPWSCPRRSSEDAGVTLREVERQDALALFTMLSHPHSRPGDRSVSTLARRSRGANRIRSASIAATDAGCGSRSFPTPARSAGVFRVREIEPGFGSAEWEFALAHEHWGGGLFFRAAPIVIDFVFDVLGAHRLEARAAMPNARGLAALRKLGAVQEAVLRQSVRFEAASITIKRCSRCSPTTGARAAT